MQLKGKEILILEEKNRQAGTIKTTDDKGDGTAEERHIYTGGHVS